jgi:anti-sigma factor RsiW
MSCRRVRRELLDLLRFGDPSSRADAYLGHVERCPECQHEVAVDSGLARELRSALRARVDGFEPSPAVWRGIRLRAADPEPALGGWLGSLVAAGRAVRVMVPVAAIMLAAVFSWTQLDSPIGMHELAADRAMASRAHWQEQISAAVVVERQQRAADNIAPSPSIQLPRPSGEIPYADAINSVKVFAPQVPSVGSIVDGVFK